MDLEFIKVLLASSVFAGIVSVIVSYVTAIRLKNLEFRNEYYKQLVQKRIQAYEFTEVLISDLTQIIIDTDKNGEPYHSFFNDDEEGFIEFQDNLMKASSSNLWLDDNTVDILQKLNQLTFSISNNIHGKSKEEIILIGEEYKNSFSRLRIELENSIKEGLYNLHDIKSALKIKTKVQHKVIYKKGNPNNNF